MKTRRQRKVTIGALCLGLAFAVFSLNNTPVHAQSAQPKPAAPAVNLADPTLKKTSMTTQRAAGTFDVKLVPLTLSDKPEGDLRGRMSIDKVFKGDLDATTKGEMLMTGTPVKGSAAYAAIETVTGKLHGKSGSFVLMHQGIMNRGAPSLSVMVVPDSGTGELTGLAGKLNIIIEGGKHSYEFEYSIEPKS
jgi:hypothetical protein